MFAILVKAHHTILVSPLEMLHADWQQYGSGAVGSCALLRVSLIAGHCTIR